MGNAVLACAIVIAVVFIVCLFLSLRDMTRFGRGGP